MPAHQRLLVHRNGPTLWPENRDEAAVLGIRATTPNRIWWGTLQGLPSAPGGTVFLEKWWDSQETRYEAADKSWVNRCIARYISVDADESTNENTAYTAIVIGELMPDYRLAIRYTWRARMHYPDQERRITALAKQYNQDEKLRGVIIENASNGTALIQTFSMVAEPWIRQLITPYNPSVSKEDRASQASVWCKNGMVLLPLPGDDVRWLWDFEDELFNFPGGEYMDQVDAFSQLVIFLEHFLSRGYLKRSGLQ